MKKKILKFLQEYKIDFINIAIIILGCIFWFSLIASAIGNYLCYNLSTCYSILLFLIGTIITLKLLILNEKNRRKELLLFILGIIFNFIFILVAFEYDSLSITLDLESNVQNIDYNEVRKAAIILNGAIWIDSYILLVNAMQAICLLFKKQFHANAVMNNIEEIQEKSISLEQNDLFGDWLKREDTSNLISKALTDKSYKDIYREINKCEMDDYNTNFEMATYGDSILKMGLMTILYEKEIKKPTEVKKKYESDEALVKYIASHYNILSKIKYNRNKILVDNYDYDSNYKYDKNGKKNGNHCKFIATCVEALLAAIYMETKDMDVILKIINYWIEIIDSKSSKTEIL